MQIVEWDETLITGHKQLDSYHEKLVKGVNKLFLMLEDTKKNYPTLKKDAIKLKQLLYKHFELESQLLFQYNIKSSEEHINAHKTFVESIELFSLYDLPPTIYALLICEKIILYFAQHFSIFDKIDLVLLKQKINTNELYK